MSRLSGICLALSLLLISGSAYSGPAGEFAQRLEVNAPPKGANIIYLENLQLYGSERLRAINFSSEPATLRLSMFDDAGDLMPSGLGDGLLRLEAGAGLEFSRLDLFKTLGPAANAGWALASLDNSSLGGPVLFSVDAASEAPGFCQSAAHTDFVLPGPDDGPSATGLLNLINVSPEFAAVEVQFIDAQGKILATASLAVPPFGRLQRAIAELLAESSRAQPDYAYLRIKSSEPLLICNQTSDGGNAERPSVLPVSLGEAAYVPHFIESRVGLSLTSELYLINTATRARLVRIAMVEDGDVGSSRAEANVVPLRLEAGSCVRLDVAALFGIEGASGPIAGALLIDADGEGVVGSLFVKDARSGQTLAMLPFEHDTFTEAVFPLEVWTKQEAAASLAGLALLNPGNRDASLALEFRDADGRIVGRESLKLKAGHRLVKLVDRSAAAAPAFVKIDSNAEITGIGLVWTDPFVSLAAIRRWAR